MNTFKVTWYTICWNENDIVKYVIDYWKKIKEQVDLNVVVYDNHSDDGCIDELKKYDWIEIRYFESDHSLNDEIHMNIKNNCWKEAKGKIDFAIVSDFDEVLWGDFVSELQYMHDNNYNVLGTLWYALCSKEFPTYQEGKYLHQIVKRGYEQIYINMNYYGLGKFMLIDVNKIDDMGWTQGSHRHNTKPEARIYKSNKIYAFHINKGLSEDYFVKRTKILEKRLSETNIKKGYGFHYKYDENTLRTNYRENYNSSIDISNL